MSPALNCGDCVAGNDELLWSVRGSPRQCQGDRRSHREQVYSALLVDESDNGKLATHNGVVPSR